MSAYQISIYPAKDDMGKPIVDKFMVGITGPRSCNILQEYDAKTTADARTFAEGIITERELFFKTEQRKSDPTEPISVIVDSDELLEAVLND